MKSNLPPGSIVCLNGATVGILNTDKHEWVDAHAFGLYELVEYNRVDPGAYIFSSGWFIMKHPADPYDPVFWIDDDVLWEQTDPKGYARNLVNERESEFHQV